MWLARENLKNAPDFRWNCARPSRSCVHEYPIGFAESKDLLVSCADEFVAAQRADFAEVSDPSENSDLFAGKGWVEVFDVMGSGHPGCAELPGQSCATGGGGMGNGGVLHPLDICHVVHVAISVHDFRRDGEFQTKNRIWLGLGSRGIAGHEWKRNDAGKQRQG
jgi:hypothetical protein